MAEQQIPAASYAVIGGSGTLSSDFPRASMAADVEILADGCTLQHPTARVLRSASSPSRDGAC